MLSVFRFFGSFLTSCVFFVGLCPFGNKFLFMQKKKKRLSGCMECQSPWTKKSPISADFSEKNWISVVVKNILGLKNQKKKNRRKIADFSDKNRFSPEKKSIFSDKNRFFLEFFFFCFFSWLQKYEKKIASDGFRTHPKCLEVAPSNHQTTDCTYYI